MGRRMGGGFRVWRETSWMKIRGHKLPTDGPDHTTTGLKITFCHLTKTGQFTPNVNKKTFVQTLCPDKNYSHAHYQPPPSLKQFWYQMKCLSSSFTKFVVRSF